MNSINLSDINKNTIDARRNSWNMSKINSDNFNDDSLNVQPQSNDIEIQFVRPQSKSNQSKHKMK